MVDNFGHAMKLDNIGWNAVDMKWSLLQASEQQWIRYVFYSLKRLLRFRINDMHVLVK